MCSARTTGIRDKSCILHMRKTSPELEFGANNGKVTMAVGPLGSLRLICDVDHLKFDYLKFLYQCAKENRPPIFDV